MGPSPPDGPEPLNSRRGLLPDGHETLELVGTEFFTLELVGTLPLSSRPADCRFQPQASPSPIQSHCGWTFLGAVSALSLSSGDGFGWAFEYGASW